MDVLYGVSPNESHELVIELSKDIQNFVWYRSFFQTVFHAKVWYPGKLPNVCRHQCQIQSEGVGGYKQIVSTNGLPRLVQKRPDFSVILIHWPFQRKNIQDLEHFFRLAFKLFRSAFAETEANFCGNRLKD